MDISIIVPIYKGSRFIGDIIRMVERNAASLNGNVSLELIFINDNPGEVLSLPMNAENFSFPITLIQTEINRGIHGARVEALRHAKGAFLLFLDQDDQIADDYLLRQWKKVIEAGTDGVVCNVTTNLYDRFYVSREVQETVNDVEAYFATGNKIISPGSVLIRSVAIPNEWKENIQKKNGADDFLLWCMMLFQGKRFAINEDVLFYHRPTRNASSVALREINESLRESIDILHRCKMIDDDRWKNLAEGLLAWHEENDAHLVEQSENRNIRKELQSREERLEYLFETTVKWLHLKEEDISLAEYFTFYHYKNVAIYGIHDLGDSLYRELDKAGIHVAYFVDQKIDFYWTQHGIPCVTPEAQLQGIDVLVVTPVAHFQKIAENYSNKIEMPIVSVAEIIEWFAIRG